MEERVFTDGAWAEAAHGLASLDRLIRQATWKGLMAAASVTGSMLERLAADGVPIRHYVVDPGGMCPCQASPDRFAMVHLNADLRNVGRADVEIDTSTGFHVKAATESWIQVPDSRRSFVSRATHEFPRSGTSDGLSVKVEDGAVDRDSGQVVLVWPGEAVRARPDRTLHLALYAVDGADRHPIGEYALEHSSQMVD